MPLEIKRPSLDRIIEAISKRHGNVSRAARDLCMVPGELRRICRADPTLIDLALEMIEQKLDLAEQAIFDGLQSQRAADRLEAADMMLRSAQARKRGWGLGRHADAPTQAPPLPEIKWVEKS